ncbi:MAG: hypothetical protein KDC90_18045, partial [Ignavibacteriae bacterium]|nr:hypothetical protein [Ignavibacteriota bacterium]
MLKSKSKVENSIKSIYEDKKRNIWIGTYKEGLYKLNQTKKIIDHWVADAIEKKSLSHNFVISINEDYAGNILVGTYIGLNKFNPNLPENGFERIYHSAANKNSISDNLIWALSKSLLDTNIIWIGTANNLTKLNTFNHSFEIIEISNPNNLQYGTSSGYIIDEIIDKEKIIWTDSYAGLLRINLTSGKTERFMHEENNSQSIISNQINKILKDDNGVLWIATEIGVSFLTPKSTQFNSFVDENPYSNFAFKLKKKNISAFTKSGDGRIFIGTMDGLYSFDNSIEGDYFKKITSFNGYHIWSLASSNKNEIWIGTYGKGLKQLNGLNNKIINWDLKSSKTSSRALLYNKSLLSDSKNNVWVGFWGVGIVRIDKETSNYNIWLNEPENDQSLSHNDVWVIKEDHLGRIWIGTQGGGLNLFKDTNGGIFHHWLGTDGESKLNSNNIYSICVAEKRSDSSESKTTLWLGTDNGLNKLEIDNKVDSAIYNLEITSSFYTIKEGLSDNSINSIVEDNKGNLWLGTGSGISFFDVDKKTFTNFSSADGINGSLMNPESSLKLENGYILFGGTDGLNIFDPKKIKQSNYIPNLVITDFQLFNNSIKVGKESLLKESVLASKEIKLSHDQDVFSFEF